ncbi:MAG: molybdopterin-guanine dinucleotide biosynthesis protein B [Promethearchaeota archaeon]|jgi:molybdopterin-guanine dinucleotide biosynthesis protein B
MKIIDVIGYSGSGKTHLIANAIIQFKEQLNYNVVVIKNVKHHQIDNSGKDSHKFTESGALYSIIKNKANDFGIFFKIKDDDLEKILNWLQKGPSNIDLLFTEGFRHLNHPTILCVSKIEEIEPQLNDNVKIISGIICSNTLNKDNFAEIPLVDLKKEFQRFLKIFNLE